MESSLNKEIIIHESFPSSHCFLVNEGGCKERRLDFNQAYQDILQQQTKTDINYKGTKHTSHNIPNTDTLA
jgi:hypothetical protein